MSDTPIYDRVRIRHLLASVWDMAYRAGADDERQAIEWAIPEYPHAARSNPFRSGA